ncbi:histidine phosphatase family protein [Roseobacteraceae bacterium S113]
MTQITLVRHGQANSHATNSDDYDRLSPLGEQQARWLGEHLLTTGEGFDQVICGDMHRHHGTARGMGHTAFDIDARFDELDYFALAHAADAQHGVTFATATDSFARNAPKIMALWEDDALVGVPETYAAFRSRIVTALQEACTRGGRILIVTSGGVVSTAVRHALDLDIASKTKVMLPIRNASLHRFEYLRETFFLTGFNATPHLDAPDRAHAKTFY